MKKGKELLDPETGMFTVPEEADGEYEFSASLSADTYQDTDEPFNRPAYWAIMKEGKEKEVGGRQCCQPFHIVYVGHYRGYEQHCLWGYVQCRHHVR